MIIWLVHLLVQLMFLSEIGEPAKGMLMMFSGLELLIELLLLAWLGVYLLNEKYKIIKDDRRHRGY